MVVDDEVQENGLIDYLYRGEGPLFCCGGICFIILVLGVLPSIFLSIINIWLVILVWAGVISLVVFLHFVLSKTYCSNCKEFVHPIFSRHICELNIKDKKSKMKNNLLKLLKKDFKQVDLVIADIEKHDIFNNDEEKEIFKINMNSLEFFEFIREYKYCMVAMGSIIEFLVKRYCKLNGIKPEPYTDPFGKIVPANKKDFVNYTQSAIINNILGQRNSWFIVQNNLRNFRNYVHIEKEINEEKIDAKWYEIIRPAYEKILISFG